MPDLCVKVLNGKCLHRPTATRAECGKAPSDKRPNPPIAARAPLLEEAPLRILYTHAPHGGPTAPAPPAAPPCRAAASPAAPAARRARRSAAPRVKNPLVTSQYSATTLYQVSYHIQLLLFESGSRIEP
jgi:hypothetical protein